MGELAIRKSDRETIKIGTCENMYYIRYEDRFKVSKHENSLDPHNLFNLRWRIPTPSEDGIEPGDYESYKVCNLLYDRHTMISSSNKELESLVEEAGVVQLHNDTMGLVANVKCYHGIKLPEDSDSAKFFFNGKREVLYLSALKNTETELRICISCKVCDEMWSFSFNEIASMIETKMRLRLFEQCSEYWLEHNDGICPYENEEKSNDDKLIKIYQTENGWFVDSDGINMSISNSFQGALSIYEELVGYGKRDKN